MIYEGTIQYITIDKNGNDKVVKENYIVNNQDLFAEVEALLYTAYESRKDMDVIAVKRSKVTEIANYQRQDVDDRVYIADLESTFVDEDDVEKVMTYKVALYASNFENARQRINEYLSQGYDGCYLVGLKQTRISDIIDKP